MFTFSVQPELKERFTSQVTAYFGPIPVLSAQEQASRVTDALKTESLEKLASLEPGDVSQIRHWREVFRKLGTSPSYLSSIETLFDKFRSTKELYTISPIVDLYNWISLACLTPMAAYDVAHLNGEIRLRFSKKGEAFTPLGNPKQTEKTKNGEVVYADDAKVICRCWNKQDCHETRITDATESAVFFADLAQGFEDSAEQTADRIAGLLSAGLGHRVEARLIG